MTTWTKAKIQHMIAARKATLAAKAKVAKRGRVSSKLYEPDPKNTPSKILSTEYVGQQPAVDVVKIEDRAFRRGLFTGLQMVIDMLVRELR